MGMSYNYMPVLGNARQEWQEAAAEPEPEVEIEVAAVAAAEVVVGDAAEPEVEFRVPERGRHSGTFEDIMVVLVQRSDWNSFVRELVVFPQFNDYDERIEQEDNEAAQED